jgi:hypothetical protein
MKREYTTRTLAVDVELVCDAGFLAEDELVVELDPGLALDEDATRDVVDANGHDDDPRPDEEEEDDDVEGALLRTDEEAAEPLMNDEW